MSKTFSLSISICAAGLLATTAYATSSTVTCTFLGLSATDSTRCNLAARVEAHASASATGGLTASVSVLAEPADTDGRFGTSATAFADGSSEFTSAGVMRLGKIDLNTNQYRSRGVSISDGTHTYSYACLPGESLGCKRSQVLPFLLGTEFFVTVTESAEAGAYDRGHDRYDRLNFSLEELNGAAVASTLVSVPEPSTSVPVALSAFCAFGWLPFRKKTTPNRL